MRDKAFNEYLDETKLERSKSYQEGLANIFYALGALLQDRREKRGPQNVSRIGLNGIYIHLLDKLGRLERTVADGEQADTEEILGDIMGWAVMGLLLTRGVNDVKYDPSQFVNISLRW
jgi:hypothetical protein